MVWFMPPSPIKKTKRVAVYCKLCFDYNERIKSGKEDEDLERLQRLQNSAHQVVRRAIRYDTDAIALCDGCDYKTPKLDNLFYARMQSDNP